MSKLVVILILVHKQTLTTSEKASLQQCYNILKNYPIKIICPNNLDVSEYLKVCPSIEFDPIDPKWQADYRMFNRLKIDPFLYRRYRNYKFILFYELDAWVFKDELKYWCTKGYDYIGAPWYEGFHNANAKSKFVGIGNGGFSLRKTKNLLKALTSFSYVKPPVKLLIEILAKNEPLLKKLFAVIKIFTVRNNTFYMFNDYAENEDFFWGNIVARNFSWFKLPTEDIALQFSIEMNARDVTDDFKTPFGCHAWERYDKQFWQQHIDIQYYQK